MGECGVCGLAAAPTGGAPKFGCSDDLKRPPSCKEVPKSAKAGSVENIQTWEPMLRRCLVEVQVHKVMRCCGV